jgi:phospholipid/cholesterol/gamma-HCH transport system substrate-binding protein
METRGSYFLVGLFVLVLGIGGVVFATWILGANSNQNYIPLAIYFPGSVNGVSVGSVVKYRGVQVGTVNKITLDPDHPQYVQVMTKVDPKTPLRLDTKASLEMVGITGLAYVELKGSSNTAPPLKPQKGKGYLVIYAEESILEKFFEDFPRLVDRYSKVADQILALFDKENIAALSQSFKNIQKFSDNMVAHEKDIDLIITQTRDTIGQLKDHSGKTFAELDYFLRDGRQAAGELRDLTKSLSDNPSQIIYQPKYNGYEVEE